MSGYRLGPIGALREIPPLVQAGTQVASERASSSFTTLGGRRVVQRAPRAHRSWELNLGQWRSPDDLAYLVALASGAVPGPHFLYTEVAARANLLPADIAAPGAMGVSGLRAGDGGSLEMRAVRSVPLVGGGADVPLVGVRGDGSAGLWSRVTALPVGSYQLGFYVSAAGSGNVIDWRAVDRDGDTLDSQSIGSDGDRGGALIHLPAGSAGLQLRVAAGFTGWVTALRLVADFNPEPELWCPGLGVPQVAVDDPSETLQLVIAGRAAADYSVTLREVG